MDYRRVGQPGSSWPGSMDDVRAGALSIAALAAQHQLDLDRVAVVGHSAGGQLALWLAAQQVLPLRAVIALAAVSDFEHAWSLQLSDSIVQEFLGGTPAQYPDRYRTASPLALLPIQRRNASFTADTAVPFEQSARFARTS